MIRTWPAAIKCVGLGAVIAAFVYAVTPSHEVKNAGMVVGAPSTAAMRDSSSVAPPIRTVTALWIGDSYTAGTGAADDNNPADAESCLTTDRLGWFCEVDAEGGTGYINNGHSASTSFRPLIARLSADAKEFPHPSIVLIDAGRNDGSYPIAQQESAMETYYSTESKIYPGVPVVLIAPYFLDSRSDSFSAVRPFMKVQAGRRGWAFIDPLSEGWVPSLANETASDGIHPNAEGHRSVALHLGEDLLRLDIRPSATLAS